MLRMARELSGGLAFLEERAFSEAAKCFRELLDRDASDSNAATLLGWTLLQMGDLQEAESVLLRTAGGTEERAETQWVLGLVHLERDEVRRAHACFDSSIRRSPATAKYHASSAAAFVREGKFQAAIQAYAEAARLSPKLSVYRSLRFDREFFERISTDSAPEQVPETIGPTPAGPVASHVLLVSCDEVYLRKYGENFFSSLKPHLGARCLVHIHALDPAADTIDYIFALMRDAEVAKGAVSVDRAPQFLANTRRREVWYTCRRFYHLSAWLRQYQIPIVVVDVDMVVQSRLEPLIGHVAQADVGLHFRKPRDAPWLDISAGCVVANPTTAAQEYFRLVSAYLGWFERERSLKWHLDQSALYCVLRMMQEYATPPSVVSIEHLDGGIFRHAGRARATTTEQKK